MLPVLLCPEPALSCPSPWEWCSSSSTERWGGQGVPIPVPPGCHHPRGAGHRSGGRAAPPGLAGAARPRHGAMRAPVEKHCPRSRNRCWLLAALRGGGGTAEAASLPPALTCGLAWQPAPRSPGATRLQSPGSSSRWPRVLPVVAPVQPLPWWQPRSPPGLGAHRAWGCIWGGEAVATSCPCLSPAARCCARSALCAPRSPFPAPFPMWQPHGAGCGCWGGPEAAPPRAPTWGLPPPSCASLLFGTGPAVGFAGAAGGRCEPGRLGRAQEPRSWERRCQGTVAFGDPPALTPSLCRRS